MTKENVKKLCLSDRKLKQQANILLLNDSFLKDIIKLRKQNHIPKNGFTLKKGCYYWNKTAIGEEPPKFSVGKGYIVLMAGKKPVKLSGTKVILKKHSLHKSWERLITVLAIFGKRYVSSWLNNGMNPNNSLLGSLSLFDNNNPIPYKIEPIWKNGKSTPVGINISINEYINKKDIISNNNFWNRYNTCLFMMNPMKYCKSERWREKKNIIRDAKISRYKKKLIINKDYYEPTINERKTDRYKETDKDIADKLKTTPSAIKAARHRAKKRLSK
ncbi:hypothetical protein ACFL52_02645 [Candidatus Margulisiibacteriota bacterium]